MNKKVMSSTWAPSGPVLWDQPARPTTLALSPLCTNLCLDQFAQQAPAAARVVCPVPCSAWYAACDRRSAFNAGSSIFNAKGSVGAAGRRNASVLCFAKAWRPTPSQTVTDSWLRCRTGSTGTGRGWRGPPRRDGSSVISSALAACCWPPCRPWFTLLMIKRFRNRPTP